MPPSPFVLSYPPRIPTGQAAKRLDTVSAAYPSSGRGGARAASGKTSLSQTHSAPHMGVSLLQGDGVPALAARIGETASGPRAVAPRRPKTPNVGGMGRANIQQSNDGTLATDILHSDGVATPAASGWRGVPETTPLAVRGKKRLQPAR